MMGVNAIFPCILRFYTQKEKNLFVRPMPNISVPGGKNEKIILCCGTLRFIH
jgi:hypothetical protein